MARFRLLRCGGRLLLLPVVRSGAIHPSSSSSAAAARSCPASHSSYAILLPTAAAAASSSTSLSNAAGSFTTSLSSARGPCAAARSCPASHSSYAWRFLPTAAAAASSRPLSTAAVAAVAKPEAAESFTTSPLSATARARWGFAHFEFMAVGDVIGALVPTCAGGLGREMTRMPVSDDEDDPYSKYKDKAYPVAMKVPLIPNAFAMKLSGGEFELCKRMIKGLKDAVLFVLVLLEVLGHFVLYVLEEGLKSRGVDYIFGWIVFTLAAILSWESKEKQFQEGFVIEPDDHLAYLTLKLLKETTELAGESTRLLNEKIDVNHEMTTLKQGITEKTVADLSSRLISLEKELISVEKSTQRLQEVIDRMERLEAAINRMEAALVKGEDPKAN